MHIIEKIAKRNSSPSGDNSICIVCIGDSVTQGCFELVKEQNGKINARYAPGSSYVRKLQDEIYRLYPVASVNVINSGLAGDNSTKALERFDRDVVRYSPDLVVVGLGLNDALAPNIEQGCVDYVASMTRIFEKVADINAECIYLTPNMMCKYVNANIPEGPVTTVATTAAKRQNDGVLTHYIDCVKTAAGRLDVHVADAYRQWQIYAENGVDTTQMLANYINHPHEELHQVFAQKILNTMFED